MDYGISEEAYWNMTLAEAIRAIESMKRKEKWKAQERASMDYVLADLVGRSISRIYSSTNHMPQLYEVYPSLFDSEEMEEKQQEQKDKLSILRFKQFAAAHNAKIDKGGAAK